MTTINTKKTARELPVAQTVQTEENLKDITNRRFEKLVALYPLEEGPLKATTMWRCRCDCGNEVNVSCHSLVRRNNKSCGCLKKKYQALLHDRLHLMDGTCVEWLAGRKQRIDNVSGFRGVYKKRNGRYTVSIGFKKKIYYLGTFDTFQEAVNERLSWESLVHEGFLKSHAMWIDMAQQDPEWARNNPFVFNVVKEDGDIRIINSMKDFIDPKAQENV